MRGLLIAVAFLAEEERFQNVWASAVAVPGLYSMGSTVVGHGLSCSETYGIFPDRVSNPHLLR